MYKVPLYFISALFHAIYSEMKCTEGIWVVEIDKLLIKIYCWND